MRYIALIYSDHALDPAYNSTERERMRDEYGALTQAMASAGVLCAGAGLEPITTATTVKVRNDKTLTTDGPFAETKEQLGGYYVLDCKDLDDAIQWASRIPAARWGSIEVRPELSM
jgi:hypothetical protein